MRGIVIGPRVGRFMSLPISGVQTCVRPTRFAVQCVPAAVTLEVDRPRHVADCLLLTSALVRR